MTPRYEWAGSDPLYIAYHDQKWGSERLANLG